MSLRTIPILPAGAALPEVLAEPVMDGDPVRVQRLMRELQATVERELGQALPARAWLSELHLDDDECVVALSPGLRQRGKDVAQAAFTTLRRVLSDTDIYVGAAA
jgi:hypothetical protein